MGSQKTGTFLHVRKPPTRAPSHLPLAILTQSEVGLKVQFSHVFGDSRGNGGRNERDEKDARGKGWYCSTPTARDGHITEISKESPIFTQTSGRVARERPPGAGPRDPP